MCVPTSASTSPWCEAIRSAAPTGTSALSHVPTRRKARRRKTFQCRWFASLSAAAALLPSSSRGSYSNGFDDDNDAYQGAGYHDVQAFCRRNYIIVSDFFLSCDSPGAYYYGSGAYRNSEVCMSGDKANVAFKFTIPNYASNVTGLVLQVESGLYDHFETVLSSVNLCSISNLYSDNESSCPAPGYYSAQTYFTVPSIRDYSFHYTPDIKLLVTDASDGLRWGCSTTGTVALHQVADIHAARGLVALAVSVVAFLIVFAVLLYYSYRRQKRLKHLNEKEELQERQSRQYHYFRTLPNGRVVPLGDQQQQSSSHNSNSNTQSFGAARSSDTVVNDDTTIMSNPAYNETSLPTRPIL